MSFHFTLNGVLRLRKSLERSELQRLQAIAAAVTLTRAEIESLEKEMDAEQRRMLEAVATAGVTGAEFQFELAREASRNTQRSELLKRLSDLELKQKEQQGRYFQARMQRKIVSNLFKRQLAQYKLDQSRREQQRIDELFLIRSISPNK
jgi:flagellar biosynthesis chaperone FliJ